MYRTWISDYMYIRLLHVITHTFPTLIGYWAKLPLKLCHDWVITSHITCGFSILSSPVTIGSEERWWPNDLQESGAVAIEAAHFNSNLAKARLSIPSLSFGYLSRSLKTFDKLINIIKANAISRDLSLILVLEGCHKVQQRTNSPFRVVLPNNVMSVCDIWTTEVFFWYQSR